MLGRLRQVAYYLAPRLGPGDEAWAIGCLNPAQAALFRAMGRPDRAHAVRVARRLAQADAPAYVLEAALLHDCAKPASYGLFWRVVGVLAAPWLADLPATPALTGWRRPLQIYRWHDEEGLRLAREAGTSADALALLEASHAALPPQATGAPDWLGPLRIADDRG